MSCVQLDQNEFLKCVLKSLKQLLSTWKYLHFLQFLVMPCFLQEYQEYLQMEKRLLEELGIREESDDLEET